MGDLDELSDILFRMLEKLDPSDDFETDWDQLPERDRELYRLAISALIKEGRCALVRLLANDHVISRHPHKGKKTNPN